jgi:hypothetical protein
MDRSPRQDLAPGRKYPEGHQRPDMMRNSKPPTDLGFTESSVVFVSDSVVKPEIQVFRNINRLTGNHLQWAAPIESL